MRRLILAALLLASLPARAQSIPATTASGLYGVVDANGAVENEVQYQTGTPYTMSCQAPPCAFTPYASMTTAQQQAWAARAPAPPPPTSFTVTSTSTPALDGSYGLTPQDQMALNAIQTAILSGVTPPTTYIDSQGSHGPMTQAQLTALAVAAFQFEASIAQGQTPKQPATIP